jgi:hypothetical protein
MSSQIVATVHISLTCQGCAAHDRGYALCTELCREMRRQQLCQKQVGERALGLLLERGIPAMIEAEYERVGNE